MNLYLKLSLSLLCGFANIGAMNPNEINQTKTSISSAAWGLASLPKLVLMPSSYFFKGSPKLFIGKNESPISQLYKRKVDLSQDKVDAIRKDHPHQITRTINTINSLRKIDDLQNSIIPKSLLLVGHPGNGRATLARFIAHECNMSLLTFKASVIAGKQGSADKNIEKIFVDAIRRKSPCVILMKELEYLVKKDQVSGTSTMTTLAGALKECSNSPILFVGVSNFVENMPESFLSRLDGVVKIESPDASKRQRVLEFLRDQQLKQKKMPVNFDAVSLSTVAKKTHEFSLRDLDSLMRNAFREAFLRGKNPIKFTTNDFIVSIPKIKTRKELIQDPEKNGWKAKLREYGPTIGHYIAQMAVKVSSILFQNYLNRQLAAPQEARAARQEALAIRQEERAARQEVSQNDMNHFTQNQAIIQAATL